ncbi:unnamed protein product [Bursaphelenchus xylophilus]|uniref:(pine wood nematode) hypothetical protein n=1 Tax=Bursaphelenchus xylophilus TaxID=6326 RepID=A0A1I7SGX4_BURXY|nr:unnamed protein product [Bursaphelenchus xylophilus]CAG9095648.1 unnamed protein product [Bursaphelenchus xylophilus]
MDFTGSNASRINNLLKMEIERKLNSGETYDVSNQLLKSSNLTDFKVIAGGREFNASRLLLASKSQVFCRMLESSMRETIDGEMTLDDDPFAVEAMLNHISNNWSVDDVDIARKVVELAHRYELRDLKDHCEAVLAENLELKGLKDRLDLAYELELPLLLRKCFQFGFYRFNGFNEEIPCPKALRLPSYDSPKTVQISVKPSSIMLRRTETRSKFAITNRNPADATFCEIDVDARYFKLDKYCLVVPPKGSVTVSATKTSAHFDKTSIGITYRMDYMAKEADGKLSLPVVNY